MAIDPHKTLILINRKGSWSDETNSVSFCRRQYNGAYAIFFENAPSRLYHFPGDSVLRSDSGAPLDCIRIDYRGKTYYGFNGVVAFPDLNYIKIFYEKNTLLFPKDQCQISRNILSSSNIAKFVMAYYREIADKAGSLEEDETNRQFLPKQFSKIDQTMDTGALGRFLSGNPGQKLASGVLIFPFSFNRSQFDAVTNAFTRDTSIIQGPPGTGKTQTILNIIANAIVSKQSIAVCSNNNAALSNIEDKLTAEGYGALCAMLGNFSNVKEFFSKPHPHDFKLKVEDPKIALSTYDEAIKAKLRIDDLSNEIAFSSSRLKAAQEEFAYFCQSEGIDRSLFDTGSPFATALRETPAESLLHVLAILETKTPERFGFWQRLYYHWVYKIPRRLLRLDIRTFVSFTHYRYYQAKIRSIEKQNADITLELEALKAKNPDGVIKAFSEYSFNKSVGQCLRSDMAEEFTPDSYRDDFSAFTTRYPVILSSTYSLLQTSPRSFIYDLVVIDESSQVSMASAILTLSKAKRVVVVGDLNQLSAITNPALIQVEEEIHHRHPIPEVYRCTNNNLLQSFVRLYGDKVPSVLLNEHYRCQSSIISFSNDKLYQGKLICLTPDDGAEKHLKLIHTVPGNHARRNAEGSGLYNEREIAEVLEEVKNVPAGESLAVITPYRHQADLLRAKLPPEIAVDTIHKFQGRECDDVIFSTVANDAEDYMRGEEVVHSFVDNCELLNVAMTRAKHHFTLITSDKIYQHAPGYLGDLIRYLRYQTDSIVVSGKVRSIFDILYSDYAKAQSQIQKTPSQDEITERLVFNLLQEILEAEKYSGLRVTQHVPVHSLIALEKQKLSPEELHYLKNPWTHVDFVIYNVFDKSPVLLVEVDGVSFHEQQEKQTAHDQIKDKALVSAGLTLLRLKTNGALERETIISALDKQL